MASRDNRSEQAAELRRRAEEISRQKAAQPTGNLEVILPEETWQALHELRVHQIELEMQNEELQLSQAKLAPRGRDISIFTIWHRWAISPATNRG